MFLSRNRRRERENAYECSDIKRSSVPPRFDNTLEAATIGAMHRLSLSGVRLVLVGIAAFVLGVIGFFSYTGTSPSFQKLSCSVRDALTSVNIFRDSSPIASAGCENKTGEDGEIYYVSCGGFF